jgi:DNA-binding XRE family transcriptional regulator
MKAKAKSHLPDNAASAAGGPEQGYNYISAMKIFHQKDTGVAILTSTRLLPMPFGEAIPGFLCQAARSLLGVSQEWLWQTSNVSRKTINDFENGFIKPKIALNNEIRRALEEKGASFVIGDALVGVVVPNAPIPAPAAERSTRKQGN